MTSMNLLKYLQKIHIRLQKRYTEFTTNYPGFLCTVVDKSSFLFMYEEIFEKEIYRFQSRKEKTFIIDCGANIGLSVIYFKKLFPNSEILAFEPDPKIFQVLKKNCIAAKCNDDVNLMEACLGAEDKTVSFFTDNSDGGSVIQTDTSTYPAIAVKQVVLAKYLTKPVDFLKIDIEGAETEVLRSIASELRQVENIFIEYHSFVNQPQTLDEIIALLREAGFRYYIEHIGIRSPYIYIQQEEYRGMDLQLNIYGYRMK